MACKTRDTEDTLCMYVIIMYHFTTYHSHLHISQDYTNTRPYNLIFNRQLKNDATAVLKILLWKKLYCIFRIVSYKKVLKSHFFSGMMDVGKIIYLLAVIEKYVIKL